MTGDYFKKIKAGSLSEPATFRSETVGETVEGVPDFFRRRLRGGADIIGGFLEIRVAREGEAADEDLLGRGKGRELGFGELAAVRDVGRDGVGPLDTGVERSHHLIEALFQDPTAFFRCPGKLSELSVEC